MFIIYKATHIPTGKVYVGRTKRKLEIRIGQHWGDVKQQLTKFHQFLHTTSMDEWTWVILETIESDRDARDCELYYISKWNLYEEGFNSKSGPGVNSETWKAFVAGREKYKKENPIPWNKGKVGVYSEHTREMMSLRKQKNPSNGGWTPKRQEEAKKNTKGSKKVRELSTGLVFVSISEAARHFNILRESVRDVVNGRRNHTAGRVFIFEDSIKEIGDE